MFMSKRAKKNNNPTVMVEELNTKSLERIKVEPTTCVDPNKVIKTSKNFSNMTKQELEYQLEFNEELTKDEKKQIKEILKNK